MKVGIYVAMFLVILAACKTKNTNNIKATEVVETTSTDNQKTKPYLINSRGDTIQKIVKTNDEWKKDLTPLEYNVLREKGTERSFTGDLLENKSEGLYTCRGCGMPLFASKHKFESGTGWPSFFNVLDKNIIIEDTDYDLGYARTELTCGKCGDILGMCLQMDLNPRGLDIV